MKPSSRLHFGLLVLFLFFGACSVFETREPEQPGTTTVPVFIQPDRPRDVVENLINAVRVLNLDNYRRCLSREDFRYEPSLPAQSNNPDIWAGWGFAEEEVYFNNMRAESEGLTGHNLRFENASDVSIPPDEHRYEASYVIQVEHNRQGLPKQASGRLRLTMKQMDDGQWFIIHWNDADGNSDFTWSDYRAAFLQ